MTDVRCSEELFCQSGARFKAEPLYDVPRSTPIYAVVNMAAKTKNRPNHDVIKSFSQKEETIHSAPTSCETFEDDNKNEAISSDAEEIVISTSIKKDKSPTPTLQNDFSTTTLQADFSTTSNQIDILTKPNQIDTLTKPDEIDISTPTNGTDASLKSL